MVLRRFIAVYLLVLLTLEFPVAQLQDTGIGPISNEEDVCRNAVCIKKCCPQEQLINITTCVVPTDASDLWRPIFHDKNTMAPLINPPKGFKYLSGYPTCDVFLLQPYFNPDDEFYLLQDGRLHVPLYKQTYSIDRYCIDKMSTSLEETELVALLCFEEEPATQPSTACRVVKEYVYPVLLMVSCVFLVVTLAVYVCIPELRGKLHGRCLLSMVSSLLVAYLLMTIVYLASEGMSDPACLVCGSLKHISLLASFFWLNIMCFDIWRSLKSMRPASETSARSRQRFMLYSLYAWGCPLVIGIVTVSMQVLPESYTDVVRPGFLGLHQLCWFDNRKSLWLYFYMIVLILVLANIVFFLMVAYILLKSQNNQTLQNARSQNRDRMWLYGKLFLVMGITWVTEVISWQQGTCEAWIFTDIINSLQGFTIFLVFVCKKSTRQMVSRRFTKIKKNYSVSSKGQRSSTFFTGLSKSSTSGNTESSVISRSSDSHRSINHHKSELTPLNQMSVINENFIPPSGIDATELSLALKVDEETQIITEKNDQTKVAVPSDTDRNIAEVMTALSEASAHGSRTSITSDTVVLGDTAKEDSRSQNDLRNRTGSNKPQFSDVGAEDKQEIMVNGFQSSNIDENHEGGDSDDKSSSSDSSEESSRLIVTNKEGGEAEKEDTLSNKETQLQRGEDSPFLTGHLDT